MKTEEKANQMIKCFLDKGFKEHKCSKMAIVACDLIIQETLEEYTNDENHTRVEFYNKVKSYLSGNPIELERNSFADFKYSQKDCPHKNVVEELLGGRRDRCKDCGKTWGT